MDKKDIPKGTDASMTSTDLPDLHSISEPEPETEKETPKEQPQTPIKTTTPETEPEYPSGVDLALITVALCLAVFLVGLVSLNNFTSLKHHLTCSSGPHNNNNSNSQNYQ